jgi:hypothetical protein
MRYPKLISQGMEAMLSWPKTGGIIGIPVLRPPGTNDRPTRVVLTRFMIRYYKRAGDLFPRRKSPTESRGKTADLKWEAGRTGQAKACLLKGPEPEPGG